FRRVLFRSIRAFELPWDGTGSRDVRQIYAAVSSSSAGWTGCALYADLNGSLEPLGASGSRRSVVGALIEALAPSPSMLLEESAFEVELASADFMLVSATAE